MSFEGSRGDLETLIHLDARRPPRVIGFNPLREKLFRFRARGTAAKISNSNHLGITEMLQRDQRTTSWRCEKVVEPSIQYQQSFPDLFHQVL